MRPVLFSMLSIVELAPMPMAIWGGVALLTPTAQSDTQGEIRQGMVVVALHRIGNKGH